MIQENVLTGMWHMRVMVAPVECGTNAVVSNSARQVPTISHDTGQALNDIDHAHGKSKAKEKLQHQREREIKSTYV